eukprot:5748623-Karenia_brevis.AAC.1
MAPWRGGYGFPLFGGGMWLLASILLTQIFLTHWIFASVEDGWLMRQQSAPGTEWKEVGSVRWRYTMREVPSSRSPFGSCRLFSRPLAADDLLGLSMDGMCADTDYDQDGTVVNIDESCDDLILPTLVENVHYEDDPFPHDKVRNVAHFDGEVCAGPAWFQFTTSSGVAALSDRVVGRSA